MDPATYQILGNLKIVTTGVLFRLLLQRRLSLLQWIALVLLMIGATTSQVMEICDGVVVDLLPWTFVQCTVSFSLGGRHNLHVQRAGMR